jgi:hypothetical protein
MTSLEGRPCLCVEAYDLLGPEISNCTVEFSPDAVNHLDLSRKGSVLKLLQLF